MDSNFSSIENLWPQVDTCFRPFRATLKISEVELQCTLKILQSKTCEKAKPLPTEDIDDIDEIFKIFNKD